MWIDALAIRSSYLKSKGAESKTRSGIRCWLQWNVFPWLRIISDTARRNVLTCLRFLSNGLNDFDGFFNACYVSIFGTDSNSMHIFVDLEIWRTSMRALISPCHLHIRESIDEIIFSRMSLRISFMLITKDANGSIYFRLSFHLTLFH